MPAEQAGAYDETSPHPGLDTNPGKTAQLFSNTHPYIKNAYPGAKEAVQRAIEGVMLDEIPTEKGRVRVHPKHGKKEKRENITIATFLANKHGFDIELMPKEDGH